jgi:hypothetical protein
MGYSLVFYSLDWNTLCQELVAQRPRHLGDVRRTRWEPLHRQHTPKEAEAAWESALQELARSLTPGLLRPPTPVTLEEDAALLFVAHVQHLGHNLGELDHASASGEDFLIQFLGNVAATCFEAPRLTEWLTDRPLCELRSEVLPSWGGLRQVELLQMTRAYQRKQQHLPDTDEDHDVWLEELALILQDAVGHHRDVVTLYL